jgi:hypothetical protein
MLRQEELAFIKSMSTLQLSPALLREPRMALLHRKKPVEPQHHVYRWGHSLPNIPVKVG